MAPRTASRAAPEPRRRTGGRSARVVRDVLAAAVDELAVSGYAALSFEAVAARAGVSRTTIYRRWPTKSDLVRAALLAMADEKADPPHGADVRADLVGLLRHRLACFGGREVGLIRAMLAAHGDAEVAALARVVRERFMRPHVTAIERGIARGELPPGTDPQLVVDVLASHFQLNACVLGGVPDAAALERVIDLVLAGAKAGGAVRR
jgi:AcrR family transcriptional regulator